MSGFRQATGSSKTSTATASIWSNSSWKLRRHSGSRCPRTPRIRSTRRSSPASPSASPTWRNSSISNKGRARPIAGVGVRQGTRRPQLPRSPFTQLDGRWEVSASPKQGLFEPLKTRSHVAEYRRRSDGMRCLLIPSASVEIGCDSPDAQPDEKPKHVVQMDSFLIDAEPVSTTAYCRFLNSVGEVAPEVPCRLVRARPRGRSQPARARRAGRGRSGDRCRARAVADDPRLVVRGERLLALG